MKRRLNTIRFVLFLSAIVLLGESCFKDGTTEPNPFEENMINQDTVNFVLIDIDPTSIAGLYQNIFGPTCANSGCHDGTFEPDFRTMESSYHSLVYKTPIKDDGTLTYRVDPGNPNQSAIMKRLTGAITPQMPIEIEPDGDWLEKGDSYIQNVRDWIQNGALDLAGNAPLFDIINPSMVGVMAMHDGEMILRENGYGPIRISQADSIVSFFISYDPINNPESFQLNEFVLGYEEDEFIPVETLTMDVLDSPILYYGLSGLNVLYTHRIEFNLNSMGFSQDHVFIRTRVQDESNTITEIPTDNAFYNVKEYMSFIRVD